MVQGVCVNANPHSLDRGFEKKISRNGTAPDIVARLRHFIDVYEKG
jgi:hypothetical protein